MLRERHAVNTNRQIQTIGARVLQMCSDAAVPWADLVLTAVALVATINLLTVLLVARAHQE
jgi:hypothetical protein